MKFIHDQTMARSLIVHPGLVGWYNLKSSLFLILPIAAIYAFRFRLIAEASSIAVTIISVMIANILFWFGQAYLGKKIGGFKSCVILIPTITIIFITVGWIVFMSKVQAELLQD